MQPGGGLPAGKHVPKDLDMHNKSVDYWATYVTKQAKANGILPFWWELGSVLDRKNNKVLDPGNCRCPNRGW